MNGVVKINNLLEATKQEQYRKKRYKRSRQCKKKKAEKIIALAIINMSADSDVLKRLDRLE